MRYLFFILVILGCQLEAQAPCYFYDSNHVRYELYQTNGGKDYNWLFLPGGPGCDSRYFHSLVDELDLPGNVWLVDMPGNGDNLDESFTDVMNYDQWFDIFPEVINKFDNPILVGQSFGGMFPLLFPENEDKLKGFVILNSAPSLWMEEAVNYAQQFNLPDISEAVQTFIQNPCQETFELGLDAVAPYYFPPSTLEKGRQFLKQFPYHFLPVLWWQIKAVQMNFTAKWIPENVPTLIIGGKYDCMTPFTLFEKDVRFHRPNIRMLLIEDAGHFPWIENPKAVKEAFDDFLSGV